MSVCNYNFKCQDRAQYFSNYMSLLKDRCFFLVFFAKKGLFLLLLLLLSLSLFIYLGMYA